MKAEVYLLDPGEYVLTTSAPDGSRLAAPANLTVNGQRTRVAFTLPPQTPVSLEIRQRDR